MFRIVCFVDDKHLSKVLRNLAGQVINMEPPQPVDNVKVQKGKLVQAAESGNLIDKVAAALAKYPAKTTIESSLIKELIVAHGAQASSLHYVAKNLVKAKVLKKSKKQGEYLVI